MSRLRLLVLLSIFSLFPVSLWADTSLQNLLARSDVMQLAYSDGWLSLGHYRKNTISSGWQSQADDSDFFFSPQGRDDPQAELHATIAALMQGAEEVPDQHPQCRFPARFHWLKQQLDIPEDTITEQPCPEYREWFSTINPGSATLIFPAAYINSPSSMFGHTLLRINPNDKRSDTPLVSYALNYAAAMDGSDNGLVFAFKGIFGGYPGTFALVPYYEKIKEYSDMENRDIWEYQLNLSRQEVEQLMRHAWEVHKIRFDYYFFDENCSYRLLVMLDAARPGLKLAEQFTVTAIPADTVRVVEQAGLFSEIHYRPSTTTILNYRLGLLNEEEQERLQARLDQQPLTDERSAQQQARELELAYDLMLYRIRDSNMERDPRSTQAYQLLQARSEIKASAQWPEPPSPEVRAEQGHLSQRLAVMVGESAEQGYLGLRFRPAYHDVLDSAAGYGRGMQINFFDLDLRYYEEDRRLDLQEWKIINILSLSPRDDFFKPTSWGVDFGVQHQWFRQREIHPLQVTVQGGFSYRFGEYWLGSILEQFQLAGHQAYSEQLNLGIGPSLNLLYQHPKAHSLLTLEGIDFSVSDEYQIWRASWQLSIPFQAQQGLRLRAERKGQDGVIFNEFELAWQWYF